MKADAKAKAKQKVDVTVKRKENATAKKKAKPTKPVTSPNVSDDDVDLDWIQELNYMFIKNLTKRQDLHLGAMNFPIMGLI